MKLYSVIITDFRNIYKYPDDLIGIYDAADKASQAAVDFFGKIPDSTKRKVITTARENFSDGYSQRKVPLGIDIKYSNLNDLVTDDHYAANVAYDPKTKKIVTVKQSVTD